MAQTYRSQDGTTFTVNEDGSITRSGQSGNSGGLRNNNSNNDSSNSGCIWGVITVVVIGVIIFITNLNLNSDTDYNSTIDSIEVVEDVVAIEEDVHKAPTAPSTTFLRVSDDDLRIRSSGGIYNINVYTDGNWYVSVRTASWIDLSHNGNTITLTIDENTSSSSREDYFEISAVNYTKRIDIMQRGDSRPSADITSIWMDYNVYYNGYKGMKIHVKFDVNNMNGKTIYVYAFFYYGDNVTALHDQSGNDLKFYGYGTSNYDNCTFTDFVIFVPYAGLNMASGAGSTDLSFDISIRDSSENELVRDNNTQFTYTQN